MTNINKLLSEIGKEYRDQRYKTHGRFIQPNIYRELKAKRECDICKEHFSEPLYIHHKIPVANGGTNEKENLMTLCYMCHQEEDKKIKTQRQQKIKFGWWKK